MDHQALAQLLGNYGEFFGAIAVVLTLGYLTVQLRQSNRLAQAETHRGYISDWKRCMLDPYFDPDAHLTIVRGISDFVNLTDAEKRVFSAWLAGLVHLGEEVFIQSRKGLVDEKVSAVMDKRMVQNLLEPGTATCWESIKVAYDDDYVEYIDRLLQDPGLYVPVTSSMPWFETDRSTG